MVDDTDNLRLFDLKDVASAISRRDAHIGLLASGLGLKRMGKDGGMYALRSETAEVDVSAIDRKKMSVPCTITTQDEDRRKDVLVTAGIDLTYHKKSPVVMLNHGGYFSSVDVPIAKAETPDGEYTVELGAGKARAVSYFSQSLLVAEQMFNLVEEGILRGISVGVRILKAEYRRDHPDDYEGWPGVLIGKSEMFEYSHCSIPANPHALADKISKGYLAGKQIDERLLMSLTPHLPPLKQMAVSGWVDPSKPVPTQVAVPTDAKAKQEEAKKKEEEETRDMIPDGAKAIMSCFDRCVELGEHITAVSTKQESPAVGQLLDDLAVTVDETCERFSSFFTDEYPDLPALTLDTDTEEQGDDANKTRMSQQVLSLSKRLELVRKAVGQKQEDGKAQGDLGVKYRALCGKAAAFIRELQAGQKPETLSVAQKTAFEHFVSSLEEVSASKSASSEMDEASRAELILLRGENAKLTEGLAEASKINEQLKRLIRRAKAGR